MTTSGENRFAHRHRTLKSGRLFAIGDQMARDCVINDMSLGGAQLTLVQWYDCPDEIVLQIRDDNLDDHNIRCRKIWQDGKTIGVTFDKANDNRPPSY